MSSPRTWPSHRLGGLLACVLFLALAGCSAADEAFRPEELRFGAYEVDPDGSVEELYFEALRLHSAGVLNPERMEALQRKLALVDELYARDADQEALLRHAILSHLRRASTEVQREGVEALEGYAGRAYARRLYRAGVEAAGQYAAGVVFIAGMMGIPTSEKEALLLVAIPTGGYLLVKIGGMALKRAAFLLRRCKSADDVVESAGGLGFEVQQVADTSSLRTTLARENKALAEHFEEVVARVPRTDAREPPGPSTASVSSMRTVEVRSQSSSTSEIWSMRRGVDAYVSADVLRSRLKTFIAEEIRPEFDEPFEFFIHGTTHAKAVEFKPREGSRLFTTTDIHVARLFAQRTVGREGGRVGATVIALPREIAVQLRKRGVLRTQPVPDMPQMLEIIFEPGAVEVLENHAVIRELPEGFFAP